MMFSDGAETGIAMVRRVVELADPMVSNMMMLVAHW